MSKRGLPLQRFHVLVERMVDKRTGRPRHAARCAFYHLRKAWTIKKIDHEMAVMRALTAEGEAATAIMHALKRKRYSEAAKLDPRSHVHKAAVHAFLDELVNGLALLADFEPRVTIEENRKKGTIRIYTRVTVPGPDGKPIWAMPEPPLHFAVTVDGRSFSFKAQFESAKRRLKVRALIDYVRDRANRRNQVLYSSEQGYPRVTNDLTGFILRQRDRTVFLLAVYLLIDCYPGGQWFVELCLSAFLRMVKAIPEED